MSTEFKRFKERVYVKEGKFGWQATYIENDKFIEVRSDNTPKQEGYYYVHATGGFRPYTGPTGKTSIYANGEVKFEKANGRDISLEA